MTKKTSTKRALLSSVVSLLLCFSMLLGTTYAWFTDTVTSATNVIAAGNLDIELYHTDKTGVEPAKVGEETKLFDNVTLWEPGAMAWEKFTIKNEGTLALKYQFALNALEATVVDGKSFADVLKVAVVDDKFEYTREKVEALDNWTTLKSFTLDGELVKDATKTFGIIIWWQPSEIDNVFNMNNEKTDEVSVKVGVVLSATQMASEADGFDNQYDKDATYPIDIQVSQTVDVDADNKTKEEVTLTYKNSSSEISKVDVTVPAGVKLEEGATSLTLNIKEAEEIYEGVQLTTNQAAKTYNISLEGLDDENNAEAVTFTLTLEPGLIDVVLYHYDKKIESTYDAETGVLTFSTERCSPFTVVSTTKVFDEGNGTAEHPYIIKTAEDLRNISKFYHEYSYFKVADGVKTLDLTGVGKLNLNGSFDGNEVTLNNLNTALFENVGKVGVEQDIKISNLTANVHTTDGRALVRNVINPGTTTFENVTMHGYIEGQYNMGSFYNYGTANAGGTSGADYTVSFINAKSDVTLVCTTGNVMGGMLGHGYEGANYKLSINMDENSKYTGKMYTTNGKLCYQVMAMCSHATYMLNGVETSRYENTYSSTELAIADPTKGYDGYYVTPAEGVDHYVVYLNAQLTAYDENGIKIANKAGMTGNLGNFTTTEVDKDKKVFDLVSSASIVNGLDHEYSYDMTDGVLTVYTGRSDNYASGTITLQVNQYDAEGNLLATGSVAVCKFVEVNTADKLIENLEAGNNVVFTDNIKIDPANMSNAYGTTGINVKNGQTIDGNGFTLDIKGAGGTWDSGINTTGGLIKNLTVTGSFRGIFINHNSEHRQPVVLENVIIDGTTYTISCDQGMNQNLIATNCTFNGWTSYAATLGNAKFVNCTFGEGSGYAFCRPYAPTEFVGCVFEAGYKMDPRAAVSFENCTLDGEALTSSNITTLVTYNAAKIDKVNGVLTVVNAEEIRTLAESATGEVTIALANDITFGTDEVQKSMGAYFPNATKVTIIGNGKTITFKGQMEGHDWQDQFYSAIIAPNAEVTVKDVTIVNEKLCEEGTAYSADRESVYTFVRGTSVLFENVKFNGGVQVKNNTKFVNCSFKEDILVANADGYADNGMFCVFIDFQYSTDGQCTVDFEGCTFDASGYGCVKVAGDKGAVIAVNVKDCKFTNTCPSNSWSQTDPKYDVKMTGDNVTVKDLGGNDWSDGQNAGYGQG